MNLLPAFTGAPQPDRVYHTDLFTLCAALPDASVDMILCDLPYGTTACAWDVRIPFEPMWTAFKRVIKPRGAIVLTASQPFTFILGASNLAWFKYGFVWEKGRDRIANYAMQNVMPGKIHEDILIFSPASIAHNSSLKMTYNPVGAIPVNRPKVFDTGGTKGGNHRPNRVAKKVLGTQKFTQYPTSIIRLPLSEIPIHPTQKPVALFEYLIRTYTQPGDLVLDPCVGSGTTAIAARKTGRRFIVGDTSAEYVEIARHRLAGTLEVYKAVKEGQPYTVPMFAS